MGKRGPRRGSVAFWHRARAKRIAPRIRSWNHQGSGLSAFAGYKAGMTRVMMIGDEGKPFAGQEVSLGATVVEVPPLFVYAVVGYEDSTFGLHKFAEVVALSAPKQLSRTLTVAKKSSQTIEQFSGRAVAVRLLVCTQPFKTNFGMKSPDCLEVPLRGDVDSQIEFAKSVLGKEVPVSQVLKAGDYVDAIAVTKGKGWAGVVERMGVSLNPRKATKSRRHGGSIGGETQAKVFYTVPRAGQHGYHRRTDKNKRIISVSSKLGELKIPFHSYGPVQSEFVLVEGSLPGPAKRLVVLRKSISGRVREPKFKGYLA